MTTTLQTECLPVAHIVDDDEPFRQSLTFLLESSGWSTVEYDSAAAFLAADPPYPGAGCLILDIRMPHLDGHQVLGQLRARWGEQMPPVIVLSAQTDRDTRLQALEAEIEAAMLRWEDLESRSGKK